MAARKPVNPTLKKLKALAKLPIEKAWALPPEIYHDPEIHALETERIFRHDWLCAGRAESIPKKGDYFTYRIVDQPIIVIRGSDGAVHAWSNICRHRMMRLLDGSGSCRRIVCPYHAWTYDIDGQLVAVKHMDRTEGFDKSHIRLHPVRSEVWNGWVYVTLNDEAQSVAELLAPLDEITADYRMGDYVEVVRQDHVWNTNWKLLTENFMEGYHLPVTHRKTVGSFFPAEETEFGDGKPHEAFTYQLFQKTTEAPIGTAHPDNKVLKGRWRTTSVMPTVFPSHMYVLAPDHLWYLSLQPAGIDMVAIRYGVAFAPEKLADTNDRDALVNDAAEFLWEVNLEDRFVVEGLFEGTAAPLAEAGPLSWLERENHEFAGYLSQRLTS
ncbi:MAG: aromatic ring-hydroxylating dioxygenase subunit alpha [Pseudomonadota bacterium]